MGKVNGSLIVYFEDPFWTGVFERVLSAHRVWDGGLWTAENILAEAICRHGAAVKGGRSMNSDEKEYMNRYIYQIIGDFPEGRGMRCV